MGLSLQPSDQPPALGRCCWTKIRFVTIFPISVMSGDGWQTFTHMQSKSTGMTFLEDIPIPNPAEDDLVLLISATDIGNEIVCWSGKHVSFPLLLVPRAFELRSQLVGCGNRNRSNKCRRLSVIINRDQQSTSIEYNVSPTRNLGPLNMRDMFGGYKGNPP
jgi:hypothetical protein